MNENYNSNVDLHSENSLGSIDPFTQTNTDNICESDWKQYRKYFKILELDEDCNIKQALKNYMNLKSLFSSSVQTAMYSIDSVSSSATELDEAYSKVKEYLDKKGNSLTDQPSIFSGIIPQNRQQSDAFSPGFENKDPVLLNQSNQLDDEMFNLDTEPEIIGYTSNTNGSTNLNSDPNSTLNTNIKEKITEDTNKTSTIIPSSYSTSTGSSLSQSTNRAGAYGSKEDNEIINQILSESDPGAGLTWKRIREAQNISLEEIQLKTKILSHNLAAIEEENFSVFIALVFLKGFIKAYLKAIHVSDSKCYDSYIKKAQAYFNKK